VKYSVLGRVGSEQPHTQAAHWDDEEINTWSSRHSKTFWKQSLPFRENLQRWNTIALQPITVT